jgi:NADH-quinone oxidoreductase subunit H
MVACILVLVAFFTLAERKLMALVQRRRGPNVTGFSGLIQPIADGVKLIFKEIILPKDSNKFFFLFAPIITFSLAMVTWPFVLSFAPQNKYTVFLFSVIATSDFSLIIVFAISSLSIFGIIISGWASNSKYALIGSIRSVAQMISYEIALGFVFLAVCYLAESFDFYDIVRSQKDMANVIPLLPLTPIFYIIGLAETNRAPFDLPEAEAEIVAGYNIEYSAIIFSLFFLGEYSNMFVMSILNTTLFFGITCYNYFFFYVFTLFFACLFVLVRAALPRVRYDQLMYLGWQVLLPFTLSFFILLISVFYVDDLFKFWGNSRYSDIYYKLKLMRS